MEEEEKEEKTRRTRLAQENAFTPRRKKDDLEKGGLHGAEVEPGPWTHQRLYFCHSASQRNVKCKKINKPNLRLSRLTPIWSKMDADDDILDLQPAPSRRCRPLVTTWQLAICRRLSPPRPSPPCAARYRPGTVLVRYATVLVLSSINQSINERLND